jgi:hypothetical protein
VKANQFQSDQAGVIFAHLTTLNAHVLLLNTSTLWRSWVHVHTLLGLPSYNSDWDIGNASPVLRGFPWIMIPERPEQLSYALTTAMDEKCSSKLDPTSSSGLLFWEDVLDVTLRSARWHFKGKINKDCRGIFLRAAGDHLIKLQLAQSDALPSLETAIFRRSF